MTATSSTKAPRRGGARAGSGRKPRPLPKLSLPKNASARAVLEALMRSDSIAPNLRLRAAGEVAKLDRDEREAAEAKVRWGELGDDV